MIIGTSLDPIPIYLNPLETQVQIVSSTPRSGYVNLQPKVWGSANC